MCVISFQAYDSNDPPMRSATAEDLLRATKPVTLATAKAVAAGNSCKQDDIIVAANMGRKAIFDLLMVSKVNPSLYFFLIIIFINAEVFRAYVW